MCLVASLYVRPPFSWLSFLNVALMSFSQCFMPSIDNSRWMRTDITWPMSCHAATDNRAASRNKSIRVLDCLRSNSLASTKALTELGPTPYLVLTLLSGQCDCVPSISTHAANHFVLSAMPGFWPELSACHEGCVLCLLSMYQATFAQCRLRNFVTSAVDAMAATSVRASLDSVKPKRQ